MAVMKFRVTQGDHRGAETYGMNPNSAARRLTGKRGLIVERTTVPGEWRVLRQSGAVGMPAAIVCVMVER